MSALDRALRGALARVYPELDTIKLVNFKVRILDGAKASDAITRVLLDSSDGEQEWGAIGVSDNVIEASWEALVDSLELGMQAGRRPRARTRRALLVTAYDTSGAPDRSGRPIRLRGRCSASPRSRRCSRSCAPASSRWGRAGPSSNVRFAARVGARCASAVSSGTAGLHLALRAVGVSDGPR